MKTSHLPRSKNIPSVVLIKQHFSVTKEADVCEATVRELKKLFPDRTAIKEKIVGLTCPSRGIRDIAQVLITAVSFLKPHCKEVRILTAMGTHGGGTSEGERAMASARGVTEEAVGTRIFSNMETRYIDTVNDVEAHVSEDALACDLVILTSRIKEHTDIDWPEPLPEGFLWVGKRLDKNSCPWRIEAARHRTTSAYPNNRSRGGDRDLFPADYRRKGACNLGWTWNH